MQPPFSGAHETYAKLEPLIDQARAHREPLQHLGALPSELVATYVPGPNKLFTLDGTLSPSGSLKAYGAANTLYSLTLQEEQSVEKVATVGANNWSQAVAYAAHLADIGTTVYVPESIAEQREAALKEYGANIVYCPTLAEAAKAAEHADDNTELLPAQNLHNITGQALAFDDILAGLQKNNIDAKTDPVTLLVQVGSGNLLTGIATAAFQARKRGHIGAGFSLCAVQPKRFDIALQRAKDIQIRRPHPPYENNVDPVFGEIAVANPSRQAVEYCADTSFVQQMRTVTLTDCGRAAHTLYSTLGKCIEAAGLVSAAAFADAAESAAKNTLRPTTFVAIATGANYSPETWEYITDAARRKQVAMLAKLVAAEPARDKPSGGHTLRVWGGMQNG